MTYPTQQAADDAMHAKIQREIRVERRLLDGWRRRHPHAGPEEREELARYAEAAKASIEALNHELKSLRPPETKAA